MSSLLPGTKWHSVNSSKWKCCAVLGKIVGECVPLTMILNNYKGRAYFLDSIMAYTLLIKSSELNLSGIQSMTEWQVDHLRRGVRAQSTLGRMTFLPEKMYEKLTKCPNFT